jgi:hypothetical protein
LSITIRPTRIPEITEATSRRHAATSEGDFCDEVKSREAARNIRGNAEQAQKKSHRLLEGQRLIKHLWVAFQNEKQLCGMLKNSPRA